LEFEMLDPKPENQRVAAQLRDAATLLALRGRRGLTGIKRGSPRIGRLKRLYRRRSVLK